MTKQEAIALVREVSNYMATRPEIDEAIDMAIKALESERIEIIRCENCRHDNNCEIQYSAQEGSKFFCGWAERREE